MRQCKPQLSCREIKKSTFFNRTKSGQTCDHDKKVILVPLLIMFQMHMKNRTTGIDEKKIYKTTQ